MLSKFLETLKSQKNCGFKFIKDINLNVYVDGYLGGDEYTKRSTIGFLINMSQISIS